MYLFGEHNPIRNSCHFNQTSQTQILYRILPVPAQAPAGLWCTTMLESFRSFLSLTLQKRPKRRMNLLS